MSTGIQISGIIQVRHCFFIVHLLLLSLAAHQGVGLFYQYVEQQLTISHVPSQSERQKTNAMRMPAALPLSHYQTIVTRNLFKTLINRSHAPEIQAVEQLAETSLDLRLWGTVTANAGQAYAVIQEAERRAPQLLYKKGDTVKNATIVRILREKVVLNVDGQDEVLALQKRSSTARQRPPVNANSRKIVRRLSIPRATINRAMANLNELVTQARIRPHQKGLIIDSIKSRSIFRRLGLRNGDILVGIEGQPIQTVDEALVFYDRLRSADRVSVELMRRGRVREMQYRIR